MKRHCPAAASTRVLPPFPSPALVGEEGDPRLSRLPRIGTFRLAVSLSIWPLVPARRCPR
jgi:hypothetical protein